MKFPNPCCRCGYCCLHESCPVAQQVFGITKDDHCPALRFEGGAVCLIAQEDPEIIGVGAGCCMKANKNKNGVPFDFASLPPAVKFHVAAMKATEKLATLREKYHVRT